MKTNYLNLIRTKVKKPFKGGNGDIMKAASAAKDLVKSDDAKKLMGATKDVLLSKDKNAAMANLQNAANNLTKTEQGQKLVGMANNLAQSQEGQKLVGMANNLAQSQEGQNIVGSEKGQKNIKEDVLTTNNKRDRKFADDSLEEENEKNNKTLLRLKKDFIKNNNKSVSYPEYLQVLPLDNHMKHKLSNDFNIHIDDIKKKIESARELINRQEEVNTDNQAILDKIREEYVDEQQTSDINMEEKLSNYFKSASKLFGNAIVKLINYIFDFIRIIVSFIRSPIGWAIITIIVLCIVVCIILFMVLPLFGVNIIKDEEKENDGDNNEDKDKVGCSNKFKMDGIEEKWNWGNFMKNPAGYSLDKGLNGVKMPNALTNMYYNVFKPLGKGIENLSGNSIDKYKFNRPVNSKQRTDSITNIDYDLLSNNIQDKYSESFKNKNNSITLLKPTDIKWEFPHLDYRNTDYSNIPESIKKYKDENDKDAYSLNDTKNINFKWDLFDDEYIISCNSKFDNNVDTNLFREYQGNCISNTIELNKYTNE
jgi:hypothetical protein